MTPHASYVPGISLFAQLLADEAITVRINESATTASFVPSTRILTLPSWKGFDEAAWLLFVAHEVGHAIYTPADIFSCTAYTDLQKIYGHDATLLVWNIVEDVRIERLIRLKYRGLSGIFLRGYTSLLSKSFFGWKDVCPPETWKNYGIFDHLNVYAKVGAMLHLSLTTPDEVRYYNRMVTNESHDDVMALVRDMMREIPQSKKKSTPKKPKATPEDDDTAPETPSEASSDESSISQQDKNELPAKEDDTPNDGGGDSEPKDSTEDGDDDGDGESETPTVNPFESETMSASDRVMKQSTKATEGRLIMMPSKTDYLHFNDVGLVEMLAKWEATPGERAELRQRIVTARQNATSVLSAMVSSFRANQSAWQQQRVQTARTGAIDPTRLAQYRLTDDLFLRRRTVPHAQNHGFVLHVDWSSSMKGSSTMLVLWQVLHLIWFADMIGVPVEVYAFGNGGRPTKTFTDSAASGRAGLTSGRLMCLYRSGDSAATRADAQALMLALIIKHAGVLKNPTVVNFYEAQRALERIKELPNDLRIVIDPILPTVKTESRWQHITVDEHPYLSQHTTPLLHAVLSAVDVVRSFRQQHQVEQCISVWLTDGGDSDGITISGPAGKVEAQRIMSYREAFEGATLIDPRSGRMFPVQNNLILSTMFAYHRALTGATVVCIDLSTMPMDSFSRVMTPTDIESIANRIGAPDSRSRCRAISMETRKPGPRRRIKRGLWAPPEMETVTKYVPVGPTTPPKQTRKAVILPQPGGTFDETGVLVISRESVPTIGADAYLISHPQWWATDTERDADRQERDRITKSVMGNVYSDRGNKLVEAMKKTATMNVMRRFAGLLVPYMAVGRDDVRGQ